MLILGATSLTAQAFIRLMQQEYPHIKLKLFVRNIDNLPMEQQHSHDVIIGNGTNYNDYLRALNDVDYIYDAINGPNTFECTKVMFKAIKDSKTNIQHIVDISASEIHHQTPKKNSQADLQLQKRNAEYSKQRLQTFDLFKKSKINFTILQPGIVKKGPETKVITHVPDLKKVSSTNLKINRPTLARTAANALFTNKYNDMSLSVANG